jgi:hypothetical protein
MQQDGCGTWTEKLAGVLLRAVVEGVSRTVDPVLCLVQAICETVSWRDSGDFKKHLGTTAWDIFQQRWKRVSALYCKL